MAIGESGRIVLEVDPNLKRELYSSLALENKSLKDWFIGMAQQHLRERQQPPLFQAAIAASPVPESK
jgi:hypothetical protein